MHFNSNGENYNILNYKTVFSTLFLNYIGDHASAVYM